MTRSSLKRTLRRAYWILGLVLLVSIIAKLAEHIPGLAGTAAAQLLKDIYDYLKDMSLVLVTVIAAYLANVFQKRSLFLNSLKEEWRNIVMAKSTLYKYTELEKPTQGQYLEAFCAISESLDNMRAVYRNVGETAEVIGYYPYEQLHDMRRALQSIEHRGDGQHTAEDRKLARSAIMDSFASLREIFLEELDLEEPTNRIVVPGRLRTKQSGATQKAKQLKDEQARIDQDAQSRIPKFLRDLVAIDARREQARRLAMAPIPETAASHPPLGPAQSDGAPTA